MDEQNNSGQPGTVTFALSEDNTSVTVEINIWGGSDVPQPAHIHTGTCDNLSFTYFPDGPTPNGSDHLWPLPPSLRTLLLKVLDIKVLDTLLQSGL